MAHPYHVDPPCAVHGRTTSELGAAAPRSAMERSPAGTAGHGASLGSPGLA